MNAENSRTHQSLQEFDRQLQESPSAEAKLLLALQFMRSCLGGQGAPFFKGFWHARGLAAQIFKETGALVNRSDMWKEYRELCQEFHKVKEVLDSNASFTFEQIEMAISALQKEMQELAVRTQEMPSPPIYAKSMQGKSSLYQTHQKELTLLNAYAKRVDGLRQELIATEMRVRSKNKLFKDLSVLGDRIFPRKKELMVTISQWFMEDVTLFAETFEKEHVPLFVLKEEIKALQQAAKVLTLHTKAFTQTRELLGQCWQQLLEKEKERKQEHEGVRATFKQNEALILEKIALLETDPYKIAEVEEMLHTLSLGREEKASLQTALKPFLERQKAEELARIQERNARIESFKQQLLSLIESTQDLAAIEEEREHLHQEVQKLRLQRAEKQAIDKLFKTLKDKVQDKKGALVLALCADDGCAYTQLKEALGELVTRRKEVKEHLEELRKLKGCSSLGFEKALACNQIMEEERERLQKIEASIGELEEKIARF